MNKVATFKRHLKGFRGDARLYALRPALAGHKHVVVSAIVAYLSGPETFIFGADADGNISEWGELEGSYRGGLDHERALKGAGYKVKEK